ncbi:MAG TPA: hypothetical protein VFS50_01785 [Meiothermus sp.]|jgi:hypothetical protein|nr:hypothetical protein [Meiothermus sp.]
MRGVRRGFLSHPCSTRYASILQILSSRVNETLIACRASVFDLQQKERYDLLRREVSRAILETTEFEHGYGDSTLLQRAEWITLER